MNLLRLKLKMVLVLENINILFLYKLYQNLAKGQYMSKLINQKTQQISLSDIMVPQIALTSD